MTGATYGPLALQMGSVTGAVDDMIHGYEQLVQTMPKLSENVQAMHYRTEGMAKLLEVRLFSALLTF